MHPLLFNERRRILPFNLWWKHRHCRFFLQKTLPNINAGYFWSDVEVMNSVWNTLYGSPEQLWCVCIFQILGGVATPMAASSNTGAGYCGVGVWGHRIGLKNSIKPRPHQFFTHRHSVDIISRTIVQHHTSTTRTQTIRHFRNSLEKNLTH